MPGIFTWNGYHTVFLPLLPQVTKDASEDAWVLGRQQKSGVTATVAGMGQLRRDVMALYLDDYTRRWDELLANVALKPFGSLSQGLDELYLLSAPDSPLRDLLQSDRPADPAQPAGARRHGGGQGAGEGCQGGQKCQRLRELPRPRRHASFEEAQIASILGSAFGSDAAGKPVDPASRVDEHFRALHAFVAGDKDKPAQLEVVIGKIQQIYQG